MFTVYRSDRIVYIYMSKLRAFSQISICLYNTAYKFDDKMSSKYIGIGKCIYFITRVTRLKIYHLTNHSCLSGMSREFHFTESRDIKYLYRLTEEK